MCIICFQLLLSRQHYIEVQRIGATSRLYTSHTWSEEFEDVSCPDFGEVGYRMLTSHIVGEASVPVSRNLKHMDTC